MRQPVKTVGKGENGDQPVVTVFPTSLLPFFLDKTLQSLSLVVVKPRKDMYM